MFAYKHDGYLGEMRGVDDIKGWKIPKARRNDVNMRENVSK